MKKHITVFMLYIRSSFIPALVLILLSAAVCAGMFYFTFDELSGQQPVPGEYVPGIETSFGKVTVPAVSAVTLVLLTVLLCIPGTSFGSQTGYTMARLQISEKSSFIWQVIYNSLVFLLFWAVQALAMFLVCELYDTLVVTSTNQTVFLALYREKYLHSLLPLHEISRSIRNIAFCTVLGTASAYFTYRQRCGKASYIIVPILFYVIGAFRGEMGALSADIMHTLLSLFIVGVSIAWVMAGLTDFWGDTEAH